MLLGIKDALYALHILLQLRAGVHAAE